MSRHNEVITETDRIKDLLIRAADALDDSVTSLSPYRQLIVELRKAAQEAQRHRTIDE